MAHDTDFRDEMIELESLQDAGLALSTWGTDKPEPSAMQLLHDWILRDPSFRVVDRMARIHGCCLVELRGKLGTYTSQTQVTFDQAVRTALMTAAFEGDL